MPRVYPVGYNLHSSLEHVEELMQQPRTLLIDTRINPYSWKVEWRGAELMKRYGARYRQAGRFLGNLKHPINQDHKQWSTPYRVEIEIANPDVGIAGLKMYLDEGHDLILLCACADYDNCHMHEIVRLLVEAMPDVEICLQYEKEMKV